MFTKQRQNGALPARMEMKIDLVDQHDAVRPAELWTDEARALTKEVRQPAEIGTIAVRELMEPETRPSMLERDIPIV